MPETILQEADRLINGDRLDTYEGTDETIVALWSSYLGLDLTVLDYANLMILLKVARTKGQYHRDSYVDIAGYAGVGPRLWEAQHDAPQIVDLDVPLANWERELLGLPRVWQSLKDIPIGVRFTDVDGDRWFSEQWRIDTLRSGSTTTIVEKFAPFTEIIKETA